MNRALQNFVDEVLALNPSATQNSSVGFGLPAGITGVVPTASTTITRLQSQTAVFAQLYTKGDSEKLQQVAREIEGLLYLCQTLNILSEDKAVHLAKHIHVLLDEQPRIS